MEYLNFSTVPPKRCLVAALLALHAWRLRYNELAYHQRETVMLAVFDQTVTEAFALLTDLLGSRHLAAGVGLIVVAILFLSGGFFRHYRWLWMSPLLLLAPFLMDDHTLAFTTSTTFWIVTIFFAALWWIFLWVMFAWITWLYHKDPEALRARIERNRRMNDSYPLTSDDFKEFNPIGAPTMFGLDEYGNYVYPELDETQQHSRLS